MHIHALLLNIDGPRLAITGQVEKNASWGVLIPTCGSGVEPPWCARVIIPKSIHLAHLGESMAKRKSSIRKRKASVIPAETTLKYELPGDGSDVYIDLMRDLSAINRRGMNQGQVLHISGFTFKQDTGATSVQSLQATVKALPVTWVAAQAYMKGRMAWMEQQRRVRRDSGQEAIKPAYEDFKIYMDSAHRTGVTLDTLDGAGNPVVQGEWDYSKLVYADQTVDPEVVREPWLHLVGNDVGNTDIGLIQAYEESRATVDGDQPNVPVTAADNIYTWLTASQDEAASTEIITNMIADNDSPPYSINNYAGGDSNYPTNVDKCYIQTNQSNQVVSAPGFPALCGLIRIFSQGKNLTDGSNVTLPGTLLVHLAPGPKKGILSMNMGDLV